MNRLLTDHDIRSVCRELRASASAVSGRQLRQVLRTRYGAVGKTARVFRIWRETETAAAVQPLRASAVAEPRDWREQLAKANATVEQYRGRVERAEAREEAHQDRWAMEVDQLRQALRTQPQYAAENRKLQDLVLRLTAELNAARLLLAGTTHAVD